MNTLYWIAAALTVSCGLFLTFMVLLLVRSGKRGDDPDEADVAAPEGWVMPFFFDADEDRGERK